MENEEERILGVEINLGWQHSPFLLKVTKLGNNKAFTGLRNASVNRE